MAVKEFETLLKFVLKTTTTTVITVIIMHSQPPGLFGSSVSLLIFVMNKRGWIVRATLPVFNSKAKCA